MPALLVRTALGANAVNGNVLSGSVFEFLPSDARVTVGIVADLTGVQATVQFGPEAQVIDAEVPAWAAVERGPIDPDDILVDGLGAAGDRLGVALRNTTGIAKTVRTRVTWDTV